jgi:hypothetical protein
MALWHSALSAKLKHGNKWRVAAARTSPSHLHYQSRMRKSSAIKARAGCGIGASGILSLLSAAALNGAAAASQPGWLRRLPAGSSRWLKASSHRGLSSCICSRRIAARLRIATSAALKLSNILHRGCGTALRRR